MKISYYLPVRILSNQDLERQFHNWTAEKIEEKIGVRTRHIAGEHETATDMACAAAEDVLRGYDREQIDFVLLCTQSPDYCLPTSACLVQDRLKLRTDIGALDFNLGCSGYIYGLALAKALIESGLAGNVLLCTAETYSKYMHPQDHSNRSIFGDAAAATLVGRDDARKIQQFELGTNGQGLANLIVRNSGARAKAPRGRNNPAEPAAEFNQDDYLYMNGPEIFNFTIENVPKVVDRVLSKNQMTLDAIDYVIFHQANKYMLDYLRRKINIPKEKFWNNMLDCGNTVSSTIPIALKDGLDAGVLKAGQKVLLVGFGVGYSWGGTIMEL